MVYDRKSFKVIAGDTDSIFFKKPNEEPFSETEIELLSESLNAEFPDLINWEVGGIYPSVLTLKAKNYVLWDGDKIKYKGSALKSSTLEQGLKNLIDEFVKSLLFDKQHEVRDVYLKYIRLIHNLNTKEELKPFCSKKTLTEKTYNSERANETKLLDAVQGHEYREGDKVWVYFKQDNTLSLIDNFKEKDYNVDKLLEKLYKTVLRFEDVIPNAKEIFKNYKLKKNKKELQEILASK